jgi:hypothetical protein
MMQSPVSIKFIKAFFSSLLGILATIVLINFICDPIQWIRRSPGKILDTEQRLQVAGFVKNFDYDLVMVGNSVTENFSHKLMKQLVPSKPIFLSMAGAGTLEQIIPLKKALKTGKVKTVIWGLTQNTLGYKDDILPPTFPLYLYEDTLQSTFKYLFSFTTLQASFSYLGKFFKSEKRSDAEILETYRNKKKSLTISKEFMLNIYRTSVAKTKDPCPTVIDYTEANLKGKNLLKDVVSLIQQYPHVQFYIFLPPYSLSEYNLAYNNNCIGFENILKTREVIFKHLVPLPNVKLYDFETDLSMVGNLEGYEDLMHFGQTIKDDMLIKMRNNIDLVTLDNMSEKNRAFRQQVLLPLE